MKIILNVEPVSGSEEDGFTIESIEIESKNPRVVWDSTENLQVFVDYLFTDYQNGVVDSVPITVVNPDNPPTESNQDA